MFFRHMALRRGTDSTQSRGLSPPEGGSPQQGNAVSPPEQKRGGSRKTGFRKPIYGGRAEKQKISPHLQIVHVKSRNLYFLKDFFTFPHICLVWNRYSFQYAILLSYNALQDFENLFTFIFAFMISFSNFVGSKRKDYNLCPTPASSSLSSSWSLA